MPNKEFNALLAGFSIGFVSSISLLMIILGAISIDSSLCIFDGLGLLIGGSVLFGSMILTIILVYYSTYRIDRETNYIIN